MNDILYLREDEVKNMDVSWLELFDLCRDALAAKGRNNVENPPKPGVHNMPDSFIHAMPAYNSEIPAIGIKWAGLYPANKALGIPPISGLIVLNNPETGRPMCIMGAAWLTNARTAAVSAISAEKLARPDTAVMGIIGAGVQARYQIQALELVLPELKTLKVYDLYPEAAEAFKEEMQPKIRSEIILASSAEAAVRDSDLAMTAIPKPKEPVVKFEWLKEGVLCMPLESSKAWHNDALFGVDKFINDDYGQALLYQQNGAFSGGIPEYYAETGDLMAGLKPGRENPVEKIMVMNIGLGAVDVTVAHAYYLKVKEQGMGQMLSI